MGRDKSLLQIGEERLLQRMVRITSSIVNPVIVAARKGQNLPPLPDAVRIVHDAVDGQGPLQGIAAGMEVLCRKCDAVFVTSCDHPFLRPAVISQLISVLGQDSAVVPVGGGHWYALTALYRTNTLPVLNRVLTGDRRSARSFAERCGARLVPLDDFRRVDAELVSFVNINDEESFRRATELLQTADPSAIDPQSLT
jgi:molybdopterin-guanine dinucleotide biosynthesis protein A